MCWHSQNITDDRIPAGFIAVLELMVWISKICVTPEDKIQDKKYNGNLTYNS